MVNDLPTIFEIVTGTAKKPVKEKSMRRSNRSKSNTKVVKLNVAFIYPIIL